VETQKVRSPRVPPRGTPGFKQTRRRCKFCGGRTITEMEMGEVHCRSGKCKGVYWLIEEDK